MNARATNRSLESSPQEFAQRFAEYAVEATLMPRRESSPLTECVVAGKVLYFFDRLCLYPQIGPARVLLHGQGGPLLASESESPWCEGGLKRLRGAGKVKAMPSERFAVLDIGFLLLYGSHEPLGAQMNHCLSFEISGPLHGFVLGEL